MLSAALQRRHQHRPMPQVARVCTQAGTLLTQRQALFQWPQLLQQFQGPERSSNRQAPGVIEPQQLLLLRNEERGGTFY